MREWWSSRAPRERLLIRLAIGASLLALLLHFLILPTWRAKAAAKARNLEAARTLDIVGAVLGESRAETNRHISPPEEGLRAGVVALARQRGLSVSRVQGGPDGQVTVAMDSAPPETVFGWLADVQDSYGAAPHKVSMTDDNTGSVRASVTFEEAVE